MSKRYATHFRATNVRAVPGSATKLISQPRCQQIDAEYNDSNDDQVRKKNRQGARNREFAAGNMNWAVKKFDQGRNEISEEYREDQEQDNAGQLYDNPARRFKEIISKQCEGNNAQNKARWRPG